MNYSYERILEILGYTAPHEISVCKLVAINPGSLATLNSSLNVSKQFLLEALICSRGDANHNILYRKIRYEKELGLPEANVAAFPYDDIEMMYEVITLFIEHFDLRKPAHQLIYHYKREFHDEIIGYILLATFPLRYIF